MLLRIFLRKIDKIGAMREDVACCIVCVLVAETAKLVSMLVLQGRVFPFPLRFEEHCKSITAKINDKQCIWSTFEWRKFTRYEDSW